MNKLIILSIIIFSTFGLSAQDEHYSLSSNYIRFSNPISLMEKDYELGLQYRTQWAAISPAYQSYLFYANKKINQWGMGLRLGQNRVGKSGLSNTVGYLNGSYRQPIAEKSDLLIGLNLGFYQLRYNANNATYGNQYTQGAGYDPSVESGENNITNAKKVALDFNVGLGWHLSIGEKTALLIGASLAHPQKPVIGLFDKTTILPVKWTLLGRLPVKVNEKLTVEPQMSYSKQCCAGELVLGVETGYRLNDATKLTFLSSYRVSDAVVLGAGISFKNFQIQVGYDVNTSALSAATKGNGAFELGISYIFNKKIQDDIEKKTLDAAPIDYLKSTDSAFKDTDSDGIADKIDNCPTVAGILDNKGCPVNDRDTDGDGILDVKDACLYLYGVAEFGGCPDSDGDGISDVKDNCPYLKGTQEMKGCPVSVMNNFQPTENDFLKGADIERQSLITVKVEFDTDMSIVKPDFFENLDKAAVYLRSNIQTQVLLSGHTDAEGNDSYNYNLGVKRSESVKRYLIKKGVSEDRIIFHSIGESQPISSNSTDYGRARNRRVEVYIIKK